MQAAKLDHLSYVYKIDPRGITLNVLLLVIIGVKIICRLFGLIL